MTMSTIYLGVEFYDYSQQGGEVLLHSVIASPREIAVHLPDYRGKTHVITGFYTHEEVSQMSFTDRGLAHLEKQA